MRFGSRLLQGWLVRRYKRFVVDVRLPDGSTITAHCPNSGSLLGCLDPDNEVRISKSDRPGRKLPWTLELIRVGRTWVCVNTLHANGLAAEAIAAGTMSALGGYDSIRREVRYGRNSRIDILLERPGRPLCYVEVKSTTLVEQGLARFPDAVTERGQKHLKELVGVRRAGARAVMLFVVQRADARRFAPACAIDPEYARLLRWAADAGVELIARKAKVAPSGILLGDALPIDLQVDSRGYCPQHARPARRSTDRAADPATARSRKRRRERGSPPERGSGRRGELRRRR